MGTSSPRRTWLVAGTLVVAAAAVVLLWQLRHHDTPASASPTGVASTSAPRTEQTAMPAPAAGSQAATRDNNLVDEEGNPRPQPVPVAAGQAPPADTKQAPQAPPQKPFTREETIAKREADLKLLDDTKTRLEADLAAAKTANNASATHDLEIRIARIGDLKKKRTTELDQIRAGGTVPQ